MEGMNAKSMISIALAVAVLGGAGLVYVLSQSDSETVSDSDGGQASKSRTPRRNPTGSQGEGSGTTGQSGVDAPDAIPGKPPEVSRPDPDKPTVTTPEVRDPALEVSRALERAKQLYRGGDVGRAQTMLESLEEHRPLGRFGAVSTELHGMGNFGFRTLLLKQLTHVDDAGFVHGLLRASADRYAKETASADWQEGEVAWLETLAVMALPGAAASPESVSEYSTLTGRARVPGLMKAVFAGMGKLERPVLAAFEPMLRKIAMATANTETVREAGVLLLKAAEEGQARLSVINDGHLRTVKVSLIEVALKDGLVPASELLDTARETLLASAKDPRAGAECRGLLLAITGADSAVGLALARDLQPHQSMPASLRVAVLATVARLGTEQDRNELADTAKTVGTEAGHAFKALMEAKAQVNLEEIYEASQYPPVKVMALDELAKGESRSKWIEDALQPLKLGPVRVGAAALLDPARIDERQRILVLAESDRDPKVRKRCLETLGALNDKGLLQFFEGRGQTDEDPSLQALAREYAKGLRGE